MRRWPGELPDQAPPRPGGPVSSWAAGCSSWRSCWCHSWSIPEPQDVPPADPFARGHHAAGATRRRGAHSRVRPPALASGGRPRLGAPGRAAPTVFPHRSAQGRRVHGATAQPSGAAGAQSAAATAPCTPSSTGRSTSPRRSAGPSRSRSPSCSCPPSRHGRRLRLCGVPAAPGADLPAGAGELAARPSRQILSPATPARSCTPHRSDGSQRSTR